MIWRFINLLRTVLIHLLICLFFISVSLIYQTLMSYLFISIYLFINLFRYHPSQLRLENKLTVSLQRSKTPPMSVLIYYVKQSGGKAPLILELWEMWSTSSLPSLISPLWLRLVAPDKGPIYGSNWLQTNALC